MKKISLIIAAFTLSFALSAAYAGSENPPAKPNCNISGKVVDLESGETLAGVSVCVEGTDIKAYTDLDGNFSIEGVKPGNYNLVFSMISYKNSLVENMEVSRDKGQNLEIKLDNN